MRRQIHEKLPPGIELIKADDLKEWLMDIKVLDDNPLYKDQVYRLKFRFSDNYPIGALPSVLAFLLRLTGQQQKHPKSSSSKMLNTPFPYIHISTRTVSSAWTC